MRDDKIIKVITILDSYCLLTSSLAKLGKYFNVDICKFLINLP